MKRMSLTLIAPALALTACQQQPAEPVASNEMGTMTGSNSMTGPVDPGAATMVLDTVWDRCCCQCKT